MPAPRKDQTLRPREIQLIHLAADGLADEQVATQLGLTLQTVRSYWRDLRAKFGGATRAKIVADTLKSELRPSASHFVRERLTRAAPIDIEQLTGMSISPVVLSSAVLTLNIPMVIAWGGKGKIVYGNEANDLLYRRSALGLESIADYGRWRAKRLDGSELEAKQWPLARVLLGELSAAEDLLAERGDGSWFYVHVEAVPIRMNGKVVGAIAISKEIDKPTDV
jgi:DNA-binding CsgD family transcriptional regulator